MVIYIFKVFQNILKIMLLLNLYLSFGISSNTVFALNAEKKENNKLITVEDFFRNPEKSVVRISPDGKYLSYLAEYKKRMNVFVQDMETGMITRLSSITDRDIREYYWVNENRIIFFKDEDGNFMFKLFSIDLATNEVICHTDYQGADSKLIKIDSPKKETIIIQSNQANPGKRKYALYRFDMKQNRFELLSDEIDKYDGWVLDHNNVIRLAYENKGMEKTFYYRKSEKDEFKKLLQCNELYDSFEPLCFDAGNEKFFAYSDIGREHRAVVEYDPEQNRVTQVLAEHPIYDMFSDDEIDHLYYSETYGKPLYAYNTMRKREYVFFDSQFEKQFRPVLEKFPGKNVQIQSRTDDEKKMIIMVTADTESGSYYLFDSDSRSIKYLWESYPGLKGVNLSPMTEFAYRSNDGTEIHAYLTVPTGESKKRLPLVVMPHPGPHWRDSWKYDAQVQLLASRGYAVLQPNFRNSDGYGKNFKISGYKQNGLKAQEDITSGVRYLINKGTVNPKKIAILGWSYGGYAALAGLAFTPELYACGVDLWGMSNFQTFLRNIPPAWRSQFYSTVGDPEKDEDMLRKVSPALNVEKIKVPVLIAQGANDPIIPQEQSDEMVEKLKKSGIDVKYILKTNEGHAFRNEENRLELWKAIDEFLAKNIGK